MPFHTWIPEVAEVAPIPVVAYLPASLDKLLGIYLLARVIKDTFILDNVSKGILLIFGALTIIAAVMMALIQHNIKKLLGYHAVSQVGYMVLGLACATPLGLAAGLFHMVNNAIYKSCLFLGEGNIETRANTSELNQLGGLGKFMPLTFIIVLIASFSISGIPPFNGFVSKWMIYQGLIDLMSFTASGKMKLVILLALVSALIGSGLTLASFLKLNSGVFLGNARKETKEVGGLLLFSPFILALLCILFGLFAFSTILPFIQESAGTFSYLGIWRPTLATSLLILGMLGGFLLYRIMSSKTRTSPSFIGGEELTVTEEAKIGDFYSTIREFPGFKSIYNLAEKKIFDLYEQLRNCSFLFIKLLRYLHNGILPTYLVWCLLGMLGLFFVFFK
jgi:formate hydrogenlyase subunit 3/multisubunit Na+/H+ antiporter MnhD subunit